MKGKVLFRKKPVEPVAPVAPPVEEPVEELKAPIPPTPPTKEPDVKDVNKDVKGWAVVSVPSQYEPAIGNQDTKEVLDMTSAIAKLLNEVAEIKQKLIGFEEGE